MKTIITTAAVLAAIATSAHAGNEGVHGRWTCKSDGAGSGIVKVDEDSGTLTWRDITFRNLKQVEDCRLNNQATHDGVTAELCIATHGVADLTTGKDCVTAELCTATHGVADLTIGKDKFDCQMALPKTRQSASPHR